MTVSIFQSKSTVITRLNSISAVIPQKMNNINSFQRIAYNLELDQQKAYIEFDKFSDNVSDYLLHTQKNIKKELQNVNLKINNKNITTQNITLLLTNFSYNPDSKDNSINNGVYGRFQIYDNDNIIFAYNNFKGIGDLGIGNNVNGCKDWSFTNNYNSYNRKRLTIYGIEVLRTK